MKTAVFLLLSLLLQLSNVAVAQKVDMQEFSKSKCELICRNIDANLRHHIPQIRANTMQLLIDLQKRHPEVVFDFAILPLMKILKSDDSEGQRILASVALYYLDTDRGQFAIQRRSLYDPSSRVRRHCERLVAFREHQVDKDYSLASSGKQ